jgi:hypothetical protein
LLVLVLEVRMDIYFCMLLNGLGLMERHILSWSSIGIVASPLPYIILTTF